MVFCIIFRIPEELRPIAHYLALGHNLAMRFATLMFSATILFLSSECTHSQVQPVSIVRLSSRPTLVEATKWKTFSSRSGRFSFLAPGVPTLTTFVSQSAVGPRRRFLYQLYVRQGQYRPYYSFGYLDYPLQQIKRFDPKDFLVKLASPSIQEVQSTLTYWRPITRNGFPGIEWQYRSGRDLSYMTTDQMYLANNRLYQIGTIMKKEKFDQGDTTKFLNSIRLFK
jgi:hypothetical protein